MSRLRHLVGAGALAAALAGCADTPPTVVTTPATRASIQAHEAKAARLAREGQLARAHAEWRVVRTIDPNNPAAARALGQLEGEIKRRATEYRSSGEAAFAAGRLRDAEREYLRVLALIPGDREAFRRLQEIETRSALAALSSPIPRPEDVDPVPLRPRAGDRPRATPEAPEVAANRPPAKSASPSQEPAPAAPASPTRVPAAVATPAPAAHLVDPPAAAVAAATPTAEPQPGSSDAAQASVAAAAAAVRPAALGRGAALVASGDYDAGIRELESVPANSPFVDETRRELARAHTLRGQSFMRWGRLPAALIDFEAAERYERGNTVRQAEIRQIRGKLADANYDNGVRAMASDLPLSAEYFRKAVEYNPQHTRARIQLQAVERMLKNLKKIDADEAGS